MVRGLFTAWTGMKTEQKRLDVISNNMANSATTGFKAENVTSQSFKDLITLKVNDSSENFITRPIGTMSFGVKLGEVYTDYTQGSLRKTDNKFDLAMNGKGFFTVDVKDADGNSNIRYTRDGSFTMDVNGYVVDYAGNRVQSESGDLQVPTDASDVKIDIDGSVYADGQYVDKVLVADFEDYDYLEKYADNMYKAIDGATEKDASGTVIQGYLEQSNVNAIKEMVQVINITRAYEANQKVMQTIDGSLEQVANSVGKV